MTGAVASIGIIGLGNMGLPMAGRLIDAGLQVKGYDVAEPARAELAARGGTAADSLGAVAADVDAVVLMLPNSQVVDGVMADEGLRAAIGPGLLVVDMGSSEPLQTRALAAVLAESGVDLVDAPVSGGVKGAKNGSLMIMVGGSDADVARISPVLGHLGRVVHAGPVGSGHAIKALNNLLSATHLWATSEAMVVGQAFGLDPVVMLEVFNGSSGRSGSTENKWPNFIIPRSFDSGFGLRLMLKDMRIATTLADGLGVPSPLGDEAVRRWAAAAEVLAPDADHTEVAKYIEGS